METLSRSRLFRRLIKLALLIALLAPAAPGHAGILSWSGDIEILHAPPTTLLTTSPASVTRNALEDSNNVRVFLEREKFQLPSDITVDITDPGLYARKRDLPVPRPILQPSDMLYSSYLLHADHRGRNLITYEGSITFEYPIYGVMLLRSTLDLLEDGTDDPLGATGTLYPTGQARGLELRRNKEWVELIDSDTDGDSLPETLRFRFETNGGIDQIRVLIDPPFSPEILDINPLSIPEPASMVLVVSGLAALGVRAWRRPQG
jgi:hypothetical protein